MTATGGGRRKANVGERRKAGILMWNAGKQEQTGTEQSFRWIVS